MTDWDCISAGQGPCEGEVREYRSRSGATISARCVGHQREHEAEAERIYQDVQTRYPGYDQPGSLPPAWLDESYAGERWDDD